MKIRRFFTFLFIMFIAASFKLPDVLTLSGIDFDALPIEFPVSAMSADAEARSPEELEMIMKAALVEIKESIKVRIASYDEETYDVNRIFKKVMEENVGLSFVSGLSTSITKPFGGQSAIVEFKIIYFYPVEKVAEMRELADRKADQVIGSIMKPGMSEYEKVLVIHDYIIKNSVYDIVNADNDTVPAEGHEAYGMLIDGTGVCDSYAKAFKLLSDKAGVKSMLVEGIKVETPGQSHGSTDHAWNIASIDGEYYHIDTTWDDVSEERDSNELVYHYLNLNDEGMQKTHIWDTVRYPECTGTKYNYYIYNKLCADNYSEAVLMLTKAISARKEKLMVRLSDYKETTYNIKEMIRAAAGKSKLSKGISAQWIINDSLGILDIEFEY